MPLPPGPLDEASVEVDVVPLGTKVYLTLEQFAESFRGFTFAIDFCHMGGVASHPCTVTGAVGEKGLEVIVVE